MSEHIATEIWIGGRIPQSLVLRLCEAIRREGVSLEWGDAFFQPCTAGDLLAVRKADDREVPLLWLCDDQARWGQFEAMEEFLRSEGIAFNRRSDAKSEYDGELVMFRQGVG